MKCRRRFARAAAARPLVVLVGMLAVVGCGSGVVRTEDVSRMPVQSVPPGRAAVTEDASGEGIPVVRAEEVVSLPDEPGGRYREVVRGDTLSKIAREHGTTVERLREVNGLERDAVLQPGQLIFVPE